MNDFLEELVPIVAILCAVALPIVVSAYIILMLIRSRTKERMELIKQGIAPQSQPKPIPNKYVSLRNGFLCIGVALGLIVGIVVEELLLLQAPLNILVVLAAVLLFLGIAYVLFYLLTKDKNLEE